MEVIIKIEELEKKGNDLYITLDTKINFWFSRVEHKKENLKHVRRKHGSI